MRTNEKLLKAISEYVKERYIPGISEPELSPVENNCIDNVHHLKYSTIFSPKEMDNIRKKASSATTWQVAVFNYIDKKGYTDPEVYKRAYISKQTFSKIRCDANYSPDKDTALKMCIGLKLSLDESIDLLRLAGHVFTPSNEKDLVVQFFISNKIFNVSQINDALYDMNLKLLFVPVGI